MKFLVLFACALAVASAGYVDVAPGAAFYHSAQHLPVIGANGVPIDTAEVQHATAAHHAHKVEAHVRNGDYAVHAPLYAAHAVAAPVVAAHSSYAAPWAHSSYAAPWAHSAYSAPWAYSAYGHQAYPTTAVHPVSVNGVPQETPEVAAARLNHYAAHAEANVHSLHYRKRRGIYSAVAPIAASTYGHAYGAYPYAQAYGAYPYAQAYGAYPYAQAYGAYPYAHSHGAYPHANAGVYSHHY